MEFSRVTNWQLPNGNVTKVEKDGTILWEAKPVEPIYVKVSQVFGSYTILPGTCFCHERTQNKWGSLYLETREFVEQPGISGGYELYHISRAIIVPGYYPYMGDPTKYSANDKVSVECMLLDTPESRSSLIESPESNGSVSIQITQTRRVYANFGKQNSGIDDTGYTLPLNTLVKLSIEQKKFSVNDVKQFTLSWPAVRLWGNTYFGSRELPGPHAAIYRYSHTVDGYTRSYIPAVEANYDGTLPSYAIWLQEDTLNKVSSVNYLYDEEPTPWYL